MQGIKPQNRHIKSLAHQFVNVHWDQKRALLLGYSGGPDSKALLYSLLELKIPLHIAHVDHGWREESVQEAVEIEKEIRDLDLPFFSTRLECTLDENSAREGRYRFFSSLFQKGDYQALLLAHTEDDLAETVLKRIFEGAHLSNLRGMEPISQNYEMTIWRPFLSIQKKELLEFLQENDLQSLSDPTNHDPKYLRARIRLEILPYLNKMFGKEVSSNLALLSKRSSMLKEYLDQNLSSHPFQKGSWGLIVDLEGLKPIEKSHLLLSFAKKEGLVLSRVVLKTLLEWVEEGGAVKYLSVRGRKILVDRTRVWFCKTPLTN